MCQNLWHLWLSNVAHKCSSSGRAPQTLLQHRGWNMTLNTPCQKAEIISNWLYKHDTWVQWTCAASPVTTSISGRTEARGRFTADKSASFSFLWKSLPQDLRVKGSSPQLCFNKKCDWCLLNKPDSGLIQDGFLIFHIAESRSLHPLNMGMNGRVIWDFLWCLCLDIWPLYLAELVEFI